MPIDPKEELKILLRELFQLDKTDLDFGIYRIMNLRSKDVEDFIDNKLPATLKSVTDKLADKGKEEASAQVEEAKSKLKEFIANAGEAAETNDEINAFAERMPNAPVVRKYLEAKEAVAGVAHSADLERDIYNDLYRFFNRYYEEGDFITKPRAGEHTYMIPYNGEEIKFYWANRDQYYIKTGENFRNYVFTNGETDAGAKVTVEFRLMDAETATNNNQNKKGRVFIPTEDYFDWNREERKLTIKFYYKVPSEEEKASWGEKQDVDKDNKGTNQQLIKEKLDSQIRETNDAHLIRLWEETRKILKGKKETDKKTFQYHLDRYTTTNSFDYFIHKDLRGFLMQELDYFLKHEIFSLNFITPGFTDEQTSKAIKENILRASAIRGVAVEVIDFLAELENFQKMLFEKKKFVVQSDYCITLDLVPADLIDEIIEFIRTEGEQKQLLEWQKLGFIDALDLDAERIKADKYLVLDTQFLSVELKFKLLAGIEDLDENCGGLLINSDNFQALNFLENKFNKKVDFVYIDPPYNTNATVIIYKNGFKDSSWCSLIDNRIKLSKKLLHDSSITCTTIDDYEVHNLRQILNENFPESSVIPVVIEHNHRGRTKSNFAISHEYGLWTVKQGADLITRLDKKSDDISRNLRRTGSDSRRIDSPSQFYGIEVNKETLDIVSVTEALGVNDPIPEHINEETEMIYPIDDEGKQRRWYYGRDTVIAESTVSVESDVATVWAKRIGGRIQIHYFQEGKDARRKSVWVGSDLDASTFGSELLNDLFGESEFSFPKSIFAVIESVKAGTSQPNSLILDYFSGSGTTGHAVLEINRKIKDSKRKYILVEMGEYFNTITKPRIQKVVYSADWKSGKPVRNDAPLLDGENGMSDGISHIFQYIKLEQYEDSLNNIEFDESAKAGKLVFTDQIKYILQKGTRDSSSLLSIGKLVNPFNYEMEIIRLNERRLTMIDLVTTFNFQLGINVARYRVLERQGKPYHVIHGKRGQQAFIIIWRHWTDALDMAAERDWIIAQDWYSEDAEVYTNADNAFKAKGIEAEFRKLMFADN